MFSSIAAAPAKQSVGETISVLSGRLSSATLLEDRRAAILGLRSFAKDFPASVASGALRSLIDSLGKDAEDVDTVKVVLETLLMLFSPNDDSPEASDEIALWLADEFTQRPENIPLLLHLLDSTDFYSRLYSMQLLSAIHSARTERTEERVLEDPLGISRLASVLDEPREAVRNEAIVLLTYLTPTSAEIQKRVAFENAFERLFAIIDADGSLAEGGRTIEDCLILMANLLRRNPSNQSLFRESGCVGQLSDMVAKLLQAQSSEPEVAAWAQQQRDRNVYALLATVRLFLTTGSAGTPQNQLAFWKNNLAYHILQLAFNHESSALIKAEALHTVGDIIRNNAPLQENFAGIMVPSPLEPPAPTNGNAKGANGTKTSPKVYVIDGLLDIVLNLQDLASFDMRFGACECLKAYFSNHAQIKLHFLGRAMEGYQAGGEESANILTVLLRPTVESLAADPYKVWFASVIAFHLMHDSPDAKAKALTLSEGNADDGEEVVTGLQTLAAHLVAGLGRDDDPRIVIGYLMVVLAWLFEDLDAVNDFLSEGSNLQGLLQVVSAQRHSGGEVVQGLCAMLLGVLYEFSTKDSPIPRATLQNMLTSRLDRDKYLDRLLKLRSHSLLRDFEVTPQKLAAAEPGVLPDVFFDGVFVGFVKDIYSRISRAIDREPGMEISVVNNGVQKGISRDLVDSLRNQLEEKDRQIQESRDAVASLERRIAQEQAEQRRLKDGAEAEAAKARNGTEGLQRAHEAEIRKLQSQHAAKLDEQSRQTSRIQSRLAEKDTEHRKELAQVESQAAAKAAELEKQVARLQSQMSAKESEHEKKVAQIRKTLEQEAERVQRRADAGVADLKATISRLEVDLMKANKSKTHDLQAAKEELATKLKEKDEECAKALAAQKSKMEQSDEQNKELESQLDESRAANEDTRSEVTKAKSALEEAKKAKDTTQSELDDLLEVFADLEEKANKYKARLRKLGETVSDAEDDDDDDDEDEDDVD